MPATKMPKAATLKKLRKALNKAEEHGYQTAIDLLRTYVFETVTAVEGPPADPLFGLEAHLVNVSPVWGMILRKLDDLEGRL